MTVHAFRPYGFKALLEAVREGVAVADVTCQYAKLEPFGGKAWFIGRCPLPDHEDNAPSFYIYPTDNHPGGRFYCYGCGRSGDVLDLYMAVRGLDDYKGALIELAGEYGVLETMAGRPQSWHEWNGEKVRRHKKLRDALARSYQRRYFRLFAQDFADIEDAEEHREEARRFFAELWLLARAAAEWRLSK